MSSYSHSAMIMFYDVEPPTFDKHHSWVNNNLKLEEFKWIRSVTTPQAPAQTQVLVKYIHMT